MFKPPPRNSFISDRSKAVVLLWFSVACFWCQSVSVSVTFHLLCVTFSSVWVAEWQTFGKELIWLTISCLCILTISNFSYFPFWFVGLGFGSGCFSSWSLHTFNS